MSDHTCFEALVLPRLDAACNPARWLTRDVNDAEDVVQDACICTLKYIGSLDGGGARAWFLTIVRHASYDWYKRNRPAEITPDDGTAIGMAADPSAVDPQQALLRDAEEKTLADAVAALPLPYREVLILREMRVRLKRTRSSRRRWPPSSDIRRPGERGVTYAPAVSSRGVALVQGAHTIVIGEMGRWAPAVLLGVLAVLLGVTATNILTSSR